jgi:hypothetical protein
MVVETGTETKASAGSNQEYAGAEINRYGGAFNIRLGRGSLRRCTLKEGWLAAQIRWWADVSVNNVLGSCQIW